MTEEKPLTNEDVLRLIKENRGRAKGLDLSGREFEKGIDLRDRDLKRIILTKVNLSDAHLEGANLQRAHLEGTILTGAHLERADLRRAQAQEAKMSDVQFHEAYLQHAHLEGADLRRAHLEGVHLRYIHLEGANLREAHLEGADLRNALLQEAHLQGAQLQDADLTRANLQGTHLHETELSASTKLVRVHWGDYIVGEEKKQYFLWALDIYRRLKMWYASVGMYGIAADFYYREMEASRKNAQRQIHREFEKSKGWKFLRFLFKQRDLGNCVRLWIYRLTCGYGERPWQVVIWGISVLFGLALLYFFLRGVAPYTLTVQAFWSSLYYSAVSFTALGYGPWFSAGSVRSWAQGLGAAEAIIGVFTIALFLVTFTRKMRR